MKRKATTRLDWYRKLWTEPGLAREIAILLMSHRDASVSRLAAEYWLERAGVSQADFLRMWAKGEFDVPR